MHTITAQRATRSLSVSPAQIHLWVDRDKLNGKKTERGLRIHMDRRWRRFRRAWEAEDAEADLQHAHSA